MHGNDRTAARTSWPLPEQIGRWGSRIEFDAQRPAAGQWAFYGTRVDLILEGRYHEVLPLHVELSPTFLCNFSCPWCSCRSAREEWSVEDVFKHPLASDTTVMREHRIHAVVDHLAEHDVEIMWVGGEPTMNKLLYTAAERAGAAGLAQCIFTNGSLLTEVQARRLFQAGLVFIRLSLNAVTPEVHRRHHDYAPGKRFSARVLRNVALLAELRRQQISATKVGISIVIDENNVDDLVPTAEFLRDTVAHTGDGTIDYVVLRTAIPYHGAEVKIDDRVGQAVNFALSDDSPMRRIYRDAGIEVVLPGDQRVEEPIPEDDLGCLAAGWFGEVNPRGEILSCSDRYGDPDYVIGDLGLNSISTIWSSSQRTSVLQRAQTDRCASRYCPPGGRGNHLNRQFREVERLRRIGRLEDAQRWITDIREVVSAPKHSFYL